MMRLSEHLFAWKHDSAYMDWYEKALYNHILGQQEPETGAKCTLYRFCKDTTEYMSKG